MTLHGENKPFIVKSLGNITINLWNDAYSQRLMVFYCEKKLGILDMFIHGCRRISCSFMFDIRNAKILQTIQIKLVSKEFMEL